MFAHRGVHVAETRQVIGFAGVIGDFPCNCDGGFKGLQRFRIIRRLFVNSADQGKVAFLVHAHTEFPGDAHRSAAVLERFRVLRQVDIDQALLSEPGLFRVPVVTLPGPRERRLEARECLRILAEFRMDDSHSALRIGFTLAIAIRCCNGEHAA